MSVHILSAVKAFFLLLSLSVTSSPNPGADAEYYPSPLSSKLHQNDIMLMLLNENLENPTTYYYNLSCFVQVNVHLTAGCATRPLQTSPTFEPTSRPTPTTNHFHVENVENHLHSNLTFANMKRRLANN